MVDSSLLLNLVAFVSVIACITALVYVGNIMDKLFGGFRKGYNLVRLGLLCILATILSLTLVRPGMGSSYDLASALAINIFIALSAILIAIGVKKIDKVVELMPKSYLEKIN